MKIALLLLAAGGSRRMGRPKQLLPWKDTILLDHALQTAVSSKADEVILILGAEAETIQKSLKRGRFNILIHIRVDTMGKRIFVPPNRF